MDEKTRDPQFNDEFEFRWTEQESLVERCRRRSVSGDEQTVRNPFRRFHERIEIVRIGFHSSERSQRSIERRSDSFRFVSFSDAKSRMWMCWNIERMIQSLWSLFDNDDEKKRNKASSFSSTGGKKTIQSDFLR